MQSTLPSLKRDCSTYLMCDMYVSKLLSKLSGFAYFIAMFLSREMPST